MVFTELAIILGSTGATLYGSAKLFGNYGGDTRTEEEKRNDFLRHTRESIDKNYYEKSKERVANKVMLFSELTRIDEALATLIENNYDDEEATIAALDMLEYYGIEMELKLNFDNLWPMPLFDELDKIRGGLINEINNCDFEIHYKKPYGYNRTNRIIS